MNNTELQQVLDALSSNRVMAKDAAGNYTREVTPKRITDAIALCEASLARVVEPNRFANEPLNYGTCSSLESARDTADEARRLWLLGQYPSACVVLDMQVARLMHATPQAAAQPSQAESDLRGIDAGPLSEWVDLRLRGYVSKDECLIAVKDIPKWVAQNGARLAAINTKGTP